MPEFEIFYDLGEGLEPCQITSIDGLENAKAIMKQLAALMRGCYFVWNSQKGEVLARIIRCRGSAYNVNLASSNFGAFRAPDNYIMVIISCDFLTLPSPKEPHYNLQGSCGHTTQIRIRRYIAPSDQAVGGLFFPSVFYVV